MTVEFKLNKNKEEPHPVYVGNLFPKFPSPFNENNDIVYFYATSGVFDKVINREGDTETVVLDDDFFVVPEWYWALIEDFNEDYKYTLKTLTLTSEGDP